MYINNHTLTTAIFRRSSLYLPSYYLLYLVSILFALIVCPLSAANVGVPPGTLFSRVSALTDPNIKSFNNFGGHAVAASSDGNTVLIGAPWDSVNGVQDAGKAFLYTFSNGAWTITHTFDDPDVTAPDIFGSAVALSTDGTIALIGTRGGSADNLLGKAYLYALINGTWVQTHVFDNPDPTNSSTFGTSGVALSGDGNTVLVADTGTGVSFSDEGEVYVFTQNNGSWSLVASIPDPNAQHEDNFGSSLAINSTGTVFLVSSAYGEGRVYLYVMNGAAWALSHEFEPPLPLVSVGGRFGISGAAISDDGLTVLIGDTGSWANDEAWAGNVYVYDFDGSSWSLVQTINDPDGKQSDGFGSPVLLSNDGTTAFVGSDATVGGQALAGKAYLFSTVGGEFTQVSEFDDPDALVADHFGVSGLAMSGDANTLFISSDDMFNGILGVQPVFTFRPWSGTPVDLSITIGTNFSQIAPGTNAVFASTITNNNGNLTATDLFFSEEIAGNLVVADADGGTCINSNGYFVCTLASLAPGAVWKPSVTLTFPQSFAGLAFKATVNVSASEPDTDSANNTASVNYNIANSPTGGSPTSGNSGGGGGAVGFFELMLIGLLLLAKRRSNIMPSGNEYSG